MGTQDFCSRHSSQDTDSSRQAGGEKENLDQFVEEEHKVRVEGDLVEGWLG